MEVRTELPRLAEVGVRRGVIGGRVVVDYHPDHPLHRTRDIDLAGADQGHGVQAQRPCGNGGELRVEDGHLWFMEENQAVVHWGLSAERLAEDDPTVYQRANVADAKWYSERMRFSTFLIRMYDWQAGFAEAPG